MDLSLNVVIHLESCSYAKRRNVLLLQFIIFCSQLTLNFSQKKEVHRKHNSATDVRKRKGREEMVVVNSLASPFTLALGVLSHFLVHLL